MRALFTTLLIFTLSTTNFARADNPYLTEKQQEIIQVVLGTGTLLTEEMHSEFWGDVPEGFDLEAMGIQDAYVSYVEDVAGLSLRYQKELWTSVLISIRAGRVVKTPNYEKTFNDLYFSGKFPKELDLTELSLKGDRYLQAAANGNPIELKGQKVFVTEELVQSALSRIDSGLANAMRLLNPVWTDEEHEYVYSASKLKILSDSPFQENSDSLEANGITVTSNSLKKLINENLFIGYNSIFYPKNLEANAEGGLIGSVAEIERMYGLSPSPRIFSKWRNYKTLTSHYKFKDGEDYMYLSIHASFIPSWNGLFQVITISLSDSASAGFLLEQALFKTQIIK